MGLERVDGRTNHDSRGSISHGGGSVTRWDRWWHRRLRAFWKARRNEVDVMHQRTLPFGDYVVDRWERARALGFGKGSSVYDSCLVLGDVSVGADTWIGPFTVLDGSGGLVIGSGTTISAGVQIYTHESVARTLSGGQSPIVRRQTHVGSRVYLGPHVVVAMGVTIGDGAVVGANSFVRSDVPEGAKAMGNPSRVYGSDPTQDRRDADEG